MSKDSIAVRITGMMGLKNGLGDIIGWGGGGWLKGIGVEVPPVGTGEGLHRGGGGMKGTGDPCPGIGDAIPRCWPPTIGLASNR